MYDIAQYQLFKSAQLASPDLDSLDYSKLDEQLDIDTYLTDMDQSVLKLSKKKITKAQFNKNTKLLTDRILLTNKGLSKQETLGMIWYQCEKELVVATLLLRRNYNQAGLQICLSILKRSKKYMFDDINYRASFYALKFSFKLDKNKLYQKLKIEYDQFKEYKAVSDDLENRRRDFYFEHYRSGNIYTDKCLNIIDETLKKYQNLLYKTPSASIQGSLIGFYNFKHISKNEHDKVIQNSKKALQWFYKNSPNNVGIISGLNIRIIESYIFTKNNSDGSNFIASLPKRPKYLSYQIVKEFYLGIILKIHTREYQGAYQLYLLSKKETIETTKGKFLRDFCILVDGYLHLLIESGLIKTEKTRKFKIQKFFNELPNYTKSKESNNITLIIAKISFLIIRKKYKDCLQFATSLEKYKQRYLKKPYHKRCKLFIDMLIQIPKCGFNKVSVKHKTDKILLQLQTAQTDSIYVPYILEIIPYETLWSMLSKGLSDRHYFYEEEAEVRAERAKLLKAI